jgi:hypothetical protein
VIDDVKRWARARAGTVMVCTTGALLALSLLALGGAVLGRGSEDADANADRLVARLQGDLEGAQGDRDARHAGLMAQLPGMDPERAASDRATARSVLLSLTETSATSRSTEEAQAALDARYDFLGPGSWTLTGFVPEWMAATAGGQGKRTPYRLSSVEVDATSVMGLDYAYAGLARLDPVSPDGQGIAKSEFVVFTFSTRQDGMVSAFEAYRASSRTRDQLLAQGPGTPGTTPGPSSSGG